MEDKEKAQALSSLQPMLTRAAGRNMARQLDSDVMVKAASVFQRTQADAFGGSVNPYDPAGWGAAFKTNLTTNGAIVIGSDGNTIYDGTNAANLTDAAVLRIMLELENSDVDTEDLVWVLPPSAKRDILSIDKHTLVNMSGDNGRMRGQFGELYGIPVVLTNACPKIEGASAGTFDRIGFLMSKEAIYMAYQWDVRSQMTYVQEYLGTLFTFDTLYGIEVARPEAGIAIAIPHV